MSNRRRGFRLRRYPPVQIVLYILVRLVFMVVGMFPYSMAPQVGLWLGRILRLLDRRHVRVAAKNLEKSRGICPPDAIPQFLDRIYGHIGLSFVEMLMVPGLMERGRIEEFTRLERFHVVDEVRRRGRGMITVIGHLGNWELIGLAVCKAGHPLSSINRPIENPWIDGFLNRFRTQTGQKLIPKKHALGEMIRVLQRNEILIVQLDQNAKKAGVMTDFFGRPASTHRSPALLSLKYGTPIVVANIYREDGIHHCVLSDPLLPEHFRSLPDPVAALSQAYTSQFEDCVRAHPEQWFWVHDRWKEGEKAAGRARAVAPMASGPR
ncbi:MAG TPA: lysophospholipid acyltransferase family protein [Planctomycetota bacterium]|nr:lysophospholipid acyltransferase family protein [Planctomycetota bacterium]